VPDVPLVVTSKNFSYGGCFHGLVLKKTLFELSKNKSVYKVKDLRQNVQRTIKEWNCVGILRILDLDCKLFQHYRDVNFCF